jgi:predicted deacylase
MRKRLALILLSCVLCVAATAQQPTLTVGTATAVTGQTVTGFIEVSAGSDAGTNIPVAVIRGPKPGPTLALVAGAHGTEYASIIALEKLIQELNAPPVQNPVWIERIASVTSETAGVFYPTVKRGWYVQQGMKIGYVTDLFGKTVWEARAPSSGVVLYVCAVPSMKKGETVANIGVVAGKAP